MTNKQKQVVAQGLLYSLVAITKLIVFSELIIFFIKISILYDYSNNGNEMYKDLN